MDVKEVVRKAGGPVALAAVLGIFPQAVSQWRRVPVERVLKVEEITGISRYKLRPDIYGSRPPGGNNHG